MLNGVVRCLNTLFAYYQYFWNVHDVKYLLLRGESPSMVIRNGYL